MRRSAGHCRTKQARKREPRIAPRCARVDCPNRVEALTSEEREERFSEMRRKRAAELHGVAQ
jgi:hypothetical protein